MRLPHFVKTSCGTPSRELFRFGLPAHRHRREGWLGRTRGDGGVPPFPFWEICDFPKWLQNIDNVLRHKYVSLFVQSVRIPNKKYPCGVFFIWLTFVSYFRTHYDDRLKQMSTEIEKLILNNG